MTNIFPSQIPKDILIDPRREGERIVYNGLKNIKNDQLNIFYSVEWTRLKKNSPKQDGECDFIVVHKNLGVICFEVKGGKVFKKIDENGIPSFLSKDKKGEIHQIKNPYSQAKKTKNVILDEWKKFNKNAFINIRHAVIFPETNDPGDYKTINEHRQTTIYAEDLSNFEIKLFEIFALEEDVKYDDLRDDGVQYLKEIFLSEIPLREQLSSTIGIQRKEIELKTKEFINNTISFSSALQNKIIFQGGAGTGKTNLAIEISKTFAIKGKVLLVCFNKGLKNYFKEQITNNNFIDIKSINELISDLNIKNFTEDEITNRLLEFNIFYDSVVIDEAQDFKIEWWNLIFNLIHNSNSNIYVFYDNNQKIYGKAEITPLLNNNFKKVFLSKNFRNSKNIHNFIKYFYEGTDYISNEIAGEKIFLKEINGKQNQIINEYLKKLIHENDIMPNQISILSGTSLSENEKKLLQKETIFNFTNCESPIQKHIIFDTIYRYKGLENDIIILINLSKISFDLNLLYTGLSRARLILTIVDDTSTIKQLKKIIKSSSSN